VILVYTHCTDREATRSEIIVTYCQWWWWWWRWWWWWWWSGFCKVL